MAMTGKHWIVVGVGVVAVLVALAAWLWPFTPPPSPPPDFYIMADPNNGTVQAGGSVTTGITVAGRHGYERQVRLNASGQPAGVLISLSPDKGVTNPTYVSTATIAVDKDVRPGSYEIRIRGTADNGDERVADFGLTVRGPRAASEPPPPPEAKIEKPMDGARVNADLEVEGVITGQIPSGWYMWVLLNPHPSPGQYWPQGAAIVPFGGKWRTQVHVGRPEDKGSKFDLWVYLVDASLHGKYTQWITEGDTAGAFPPLPAPETGKGHALAKITVTLGE